MRKTVYSFIKTRAGSVPDQILEALGIPHARISRAATPEEFLVRYALAARHNMERGQDQREQIAKLRQLSIRAGIRGCEYKPDDLLAYIFNQEIPPEDAGHLVGWLIDEKYITRRDICEVLGVQGGV